MLIEFLIHGECKGKMRPKASYFAGHARVYTPAKQIEYENWVRLCYKQAIADRYPDFKGFEGNSLVVSATVFKRVPKSASKKKKAEMLEGRIRPTSKPDCDNCLKSLCDALNGIAYDDDSQIWDMRCRKVYGTDDFVLMRISDGDMEEGMTPNDINAIC